MKHRRWTFWTTCLAGAICALLPVRPANAQTAQVITSISPASIPVGTPGFTLTITGSGFVPGSTVYWSNNPLPTGFVNSTQLTAAVSSNLVTAPGTLQVWVFSAGYNSNSVFFTVLPQALAISTPSLSPGTAGVAYVAMLAAAGGVPPYSWVAIGTIPAGLSLNGNGVLSGNPTLSGTFTISVQVRDSMQSVASKSFTLVINPPPFSITTASPLPAGVVGQPYTVTFAASGGAVPMKWAVSVGVPSGLSLDPNSGILSGTPNVAGAFSFVVQALDAGQMSATKNFALTINVPPLAITTISPLFNGTVGVTYSQGFSAIGGIPPYTWAITSGAPGGLTIDPTSGVLQGTPKTAGSFTFTVTVTDSANTAVSGPFSLLVNPPTINILTAAVLPSGTVGLAYSQTFSAVGGTQPYTWSLTTGSVPGLDLAPVSGTLSGTPANSGTFTFTVQAKDNAGLIASKTFALTINPAALAITGPSQIADAMVGSPFSQAISATGGIAPYSWSANGLPDGLSMDPSTGMISGTPAAPGSFPFTVRVIDSARSAAVSLFTITIGLPPIPERGHQRAASDCATRQPTRDPVAAKRRLPRSPVRTTHPEFRAGCGWWRCHFAVFNRRKDRRLHDTGRCHRCELRGTEPGNSNRNGRRHDRCHCAIPVIWDRCHARIRTLIAISHRASRACGY